MNLGGREKSETLGSSRTWTMSDVPETHRARVMSDPTISRIMKEPLFWMAVGTEGPPGSGGGMGCWRENGMGAKP